MCWLATHDVIRSHSDVAAQLIASLELLEIIVEVRFKVLVSRRRGVNTRPTLEGTTRSSRHCCDVIAFLSILYQKCDFSRRQTKSSTKPWNPGPWSCTMLEHNLLYNCIWRHFRFCDRLFPVLPTVLTFLSNPSMPYLEFYWSTLIFSTLNEQCCHEIRFFRAWRQNANGFGELAGCSHYSLLV